LSFSAPLDVKCGMSLEFSMPMEFKNFTDPALLFEVTIISFHDQRTRTLSSAQPEEESSIDYTWYMTKLSDSLIILEVEFDNPYDISVGDTVHMLQVV
jgi:hypothetical protein